MTSSPPDKTPVKEQADQIEPIEVETKSPSEFADKE